MPSKLVVMVGPDRFHMEVARLNDVEHPCEIRSEHFIGRILVRIVDAPGGRPGEPGYEYFRDRSRRFCIQIEGRFTRPWRGSEIIFGTDLDRLVDFPRRPFNAGMAVAHMIDPCVYYEEHPPSGRPYIMSPYCACVNTLCAWPAPARAHDAVVVLQGAAAGALTESTSHVASRAASIDSSRPAGDSVTSLPAPAADEGDVVPLEVLDKDVAHAPKKKRGWLSRGAPKDERKTKRYWRFLGFIQDPRVRAYLAAHHTSLDALIQQPSLYHHHNLSQAQHSARLASTPHSSQHHAKAQLGPASGKDASTHSLSQQVPGSRRRISDSSDSGIATPSRSGPFSAGTGDDANSARLLQQLGLGAHDAGGQTPDPIKMLSGAQNDLYRRLSASLGGSGSGDNKLHEIDEEELDALLMTTAPSTPFQSFEELPRFNNRPPTLPEESHVAPTSNSTTPAPAPAPAPAPITPAPASAPETAAEPPALSHLVIPDRQTSARPSPIVQIEEPEANEKEEKDKSKKRGSKMMRHLSIGGDKDKDKDKEKSKPDKEKNKTRQKSQSRDRLTRGLFDHAPNPANTAEDHGDELAQILHDAPPQRKSMSLPRSLSTSFGFRSRTSMDAAHAPAGSTGHGVPLSTVESADPIDEPHATHGGDLAEFGSTSATAKTEPISESASMGLDATDPPPSKEPKDKRASYTGNLFKKMKPRNLLGGDKDEGAASSVSSEAVQITPPEGEDKLESGLDRLKSKRHSKRHSMHVTPGVGILPGLGHKPGHVHGHGPRCSAKDRPESEHSRHHSRPDVGEVPGSNGDSGGHHGQQHHHHHKSKKSVTDSAARMTSSIAHKVTVPGRVLVDGVSSIPVPGLPRSRGSSPHPESDDAHSATNHGPGPESEPERVKPKKRMSLVRPKENKEAKDVKEEATGEPKRRFSSRLGRPSWSGGHSRHSLSVDRGSRQQQQAAPAGTSPQLPPSQPLATFLGPPGHTVPLTVSPIPLDETKEAGKEENKAEDKPVPGPAKPEPNSSSAPTTAPALAATAPTARPAAPTPLLVHPKPRQAPLQLGAHSDDEDELALSTPASLREPTWPAAPKSPPAEAGEHPTSPPAPASADHHSSDSASPPRAPTAPPLPGTAAEIYQSHPWLSGGSELQPVTSGLMRSMASDGHGDGKEVFRLADRVPRVFSQTPVADSPASGPLSRGTSLRRGHSHSMARSPSAPPLSGPRRDTVSNMARSTLTVDQHPGVSHGSSVGAAGARAKLQPSVPPKPSVAERLAKESAENWRPTLDAELGPWRFTDPKVDMVEDNTFILLNKSMTVQERRKYFGSIEHQEDFVYNPDVVYSTAFFSNMMDFNTFDLAIGIVRMNIQRFFKDRMPVRYTLRARDDEEICMATVSFQLVDEDD